MREGEGGGHGSENQARSGKIRRDAVRSGEIRRDAARCAHLSDEGIEACLCTMACEEVHDRPDVMEVVQPKMVGKTAWGGGRVAGHAVNGHADGRVPSARGATQVRSAGTSGAR